MIRRPPRSTRTYTLFPYTTLFRSGDQIGFGGAQIALRQREPCLGLGDVGARQVADLEPVARRLQIGAQDRDILLVQLDDRLVADDVHIGADDLREDARLGRAKVGLRSEERRVGNGCVSTCGSRWTP